MKFCSVCEKPLDFIEFLDGDICTECRKKHRDTAAQETPGLDVNTLRDCSLSVSQDKIELRSQEGWILWTGESNRPYLLDTILKSAQRILAIRRKRNKR